MRRHTYNNELHNYIKKTECEIVGDKIVGPLDRRVRKVERSGLSAVLPFLKKCRNPRPGTPRLFAFAKTHKTGMQLRPVVEKCRGPTFILVKRLHEYLSSHLDNDSLVAQDPLIVVKEIQGISLMEDEVATVLHYESMYPSVMIESCVDALLDFLYIKNSQLLLYTQELEELANLVCYESCFTFCGQIYRQKEEFRWEVSSQECFCELAVRRIERRVLHSFKEDIVYFSRYVNDILILWSNNCRVHEIMSRINDNDDGLKLRLEQKSFLNVHFLDINIRFMKGHLSTIVYIKPTHTPLYITSQSMDPYRYKMAAFRALIRRAYLYCDRVADRKKEIDRVLQVARTLGYRISIIVKMLKKYERGIVKRTLRNVPTKLTKFTYNSSMNSVMKEIASRKESRMVLRRAPNLYKILRNDKDSIKAEEKAGVYKIPYENLQLDVKKDYIGVTTRNLGVRLKEHRYAIRKAFNSTILSQMTQAQGSEVKWDEATIIKPLSSPTLAMTTEKIEIYRSKIGEGCLNARDAESLPSAWKYLVKKCTRNVDQN
ncbi:uncharacterized protein LOC111613924 [Centruroides sculpturatus]|uniref:uncharacterized protein LOC111613924 n=1 Tax=Centruroides sculpturatus TaxID=218467 RepID=UPI000C6EE2C7|nr:uncharacterized protein LOC111613924 [Centruroides sculpturatus]